MKTNESPKPDARDMLESLTHAWYAFVAFTACFLFVRDGIGILTTVTAALSLIALPIAYLIGRLLLGKSQITRVLLLPLSALCTLSGAVGIAKTFTGGDGFFAVVVDGAATGVWVYMHVRSLVVLTSEPVRAHFK